MSRVFGDLCQNAYVYRDIGPALRYWTEGLGVGPFFLIGPVKASFIYRGTPVLSQIRVAIAYSGAMQVELIQVDDDEPSMFQEFFRAGREGLQHLAYLVPNVDDAVRRSGLPVVQSAGPGNLLNFAFVEVEGGLESGVQAVELIERTPVSEQFFGIFAAAAKDWDGSDPVRPMSAMVR